MNIYARGKRDGRSVAIRITGSEKEPKIKVEAGMQTDAWELEDIVELDRPKIGGTYYPETKALRYVAALSGYYFDRQPEELTAEGISEEMPHPGGPDVVY